MKKLILICLCSFFCFTAFSQTKGTGSSQLSVEDIQKLDLSSTANVQLAMSNPDYMVTAGDIYALAYAAGSNAIRYTILVDSTYKIRVSNLGVVDASGKTFLELKKQVEDIVSKNYPMSGVQFSLTTPSSFKVTIKGEVEETAEKNAWALTRLSEVLAGCYTSYSSIRNIMITSANGKIKTYDLFKALRDGNQKEDPYLRPGDVISVKRADCIVSLTGEVRRTGSYQLLEGETIKDLFEYYGNGLPVYADDTRIQITRYDSQNDKDGLKIYIDYSKDNKFKLCNYDVVYVPSYRTLKPVMFMEGAIGSGEGTELDASTKRAIQFETGTKYDDLIKKYGAYFTAVSDISNAYIIRDADIIPIDLSKILYDASYTSNLLVEPYDTLRIPFKQYFVSVAGSVVAPGRYPYIPDRTWDYYIGLAGGFIKTQNKNEAIKIVDINGNQLTKTDIITPETTITAETNSGLYYFNLYAPVVTTVLSLISTTLSILAVTGVFK